MFSGIEFKFTVPPKRSQNTDFWKILGLQKQCQININKIPNWYQQKYTLELTLQEGGGRLRKEVYQKIGNLGGK